MKKFIFPNGVHVMKCFPLLLLLCYSSITSGQSINAIENDLLQTLQRLQQWGYPHTEEQKGDSLTILNTLFEKKLLHYAAKNPATLSAAFKRLREQHLDIVTSKDQQLRVYSWDDESGGTMRFFRNVYQYKSNGKLFAVSLRKKDKPLDAGAACIGLHRIVHKEKTYYLGVYQSIYSGMVNYARIQAFEITNDRLNEHVKLIKTKTGLKNKLGFSYNFFSVVERKERPIILINVDTAAQTISIPVVSPDGVVTDKQIRYQLKEDYFERIVKGK
ncbi:hypothetical protein [Chitinophaga nivalis]|uniref:DUF4919 domain-containing protein n=1 Tax=Chitinophaga nivalis TaxID=2991709 RepID=A0ABT3II98_9BACT|nr:hypothetical protein [Chitinophaga nivalis]MCW3466627.1 hypothetical protein [Chitinophaga nivalis]MCW3483682.1 hypothetical protein [Chitinophaga nivalis]